MQNGEGFKNKGVKQQQYTPEQIAQAKKKLDLRINAETKAMALQMAVALNQGTGNIDNVKDHYKEFQQLIKDSRKE